MLRTIKPLVLLLSLLVLAGCGTPAVSSPSLTFKKSAVSSAKSEDGTLTFQAVGIGELAAGRSQKNGKPVVFEASFDRYSFGIRYGETRHGYKLWDHDGSWVLCENIFSTSSMWDRLDGLDPACDFNADVLRWILNYGTFVKIEGVYHVSDDRQPPSVDVYFINGIPVRDLVSKS